MESKRKFEIKSLMDKLEMECCIENNKNIENVPDYDKKLAQLEKINSKRATENLKSHFDEKIKQMDIFHKERDKLERELANVKSELAGTKRTLDLERQERKELEAKALSLIRSAKRKWENAEKEKLTQLNKHIEAQTMRITELCTTNNEITSHLHRTQCELETANAELQKLRVFQVQHKESLSKLRELNRQSTQGVENKLEEISVRAHNQLADLRARLEVETNKCIELEKTLRSEQDSHHCRESRLNVALELAQNELKDCQEQLRSIKATIPVRDEEIEALKKQLLERTKQLNTNNNNEQYVAQMQEVVDRLKLENEQLEHQLQTAKSDLNDTIVHLEQNEALALHLEKVTQDKATLEKQLHTTLEKEEEHIRKVGSLEELLRRLEFNVNKLEAENAQLKRRTKDLPDKPIATTSCNQQYQENCNQNDLEEQIKKLEQQLQSSREVVAAERQISKQAQLALWKKEKELSDANLDKRIATREAKAMEEKIKKLQEEKQQLLNKLNTKIKEEEEKSKKLLQELDNAKSSLIEVNKESSRNKMQADSAQKALIEANKQISELEISSASLRREIDSTRKQMRSNQERLDNLKRENERLELIVKKHNEERNEFETKLEQIQQELNSYQINNELLKETCTVLEEQLTDYERLTTDHEFRENTLIQEKMKLQKELETAEVKLREAVASCTEEKANRLVAERAIERLESETSDIEEERNGLMNQRDHYKKLTQQLNNQIAELTNKCSQVEYNLSETQGLLEKARAEARIVKEESSHHLTIMHELKETNQLLVQDLQDSVDQNQELRTRVIELEEVLEDMRQFYQERELKAGSTCQQQTKLIDYLQLKLEECSKRKKTVCDKIFGSKQKEIIPATCGVGMAMPVGYRELENQLEKERAKVKTLTEELLTLKAKTITSTSPTAPRFPSPSSPSSPELENSKQISTHNRLSPSQRIKHNFIPHKFSISLPMRAGNCSACYESIQFGKRAAICSECKLMTHLKCSLSVPANCRSRSTTTNLTKYVDSSTWEKNSSDSISNDNAVESIQVLPLDEPDQSNKVNNHIPSYEDYDDDDDNNGNTAIMESWVKVANCERSCWERKYLSLEGSRLCTYEHQPSVGMSPINCLDLSEKEGYAILENVDKAEVPGTAKSDLPFILRIESNTSNASRRMTRMDIMALSQKDKRDWLQALMSVPSKATRKVDRHKTVLRLAKNQLDINCVVDVSEINTVLLGAEDGLFSYHRNNSNVLTMIRGVTKVHQLTLHPPLDLALMIAGEDRQLVFCNLRQLKSNAMAAECSRPGIKTKAILTNGQSCHLYQIQGEMLCAATATHIILMRWTSDKTSGEFNVVHEFETNEPCSCALFTPNKLIVGCNKFFQIDIHSYIIDDFPADKNDDLKVTMLGIAKLGIFPVCVLNVSTNTADTELLLCYNEFGIFVNEKGIRTRNIDPTWSHLPFAFAFCKPYLYIVHFSSVEIVKIDGNSYRSASSKQERMLIELNNPRYLGLANSRGIYVAVINSTLDILKIEGAADSVDLKSSLTSLDTLEQSNEDDSTSEFSFTSSLMDALDGQSKRVHFSKH